MKVMMKMINIIKIMEMIYMMQMMKESLKNSQKEYRKMSHSCCPDKEFK